MKFFTIFRVKNKVSEKQDKCVGNRQRLFFLNKISTNRFKKT